MTSLRRMAKRVLPERVVRWIRRHRAGAVRNERPSTDTSLRFRKSEPTVDHVIGLEVMLFSTGNHVYVERLAHSLRSVPRGSGAHVRGSLALARWSYHEAKPHDALRHLDNIVHSDRALQIEVDLLRADCLCELGEGQAALNILSRMIGRQTDEQNLILRVGHAQTVLGQSRDHGSGPVIEALNTIYNATGFGMLRRTLVIAPIGLDNISCEVPDAEPRNSLPQVTAITWLDDSLTDIVGVTSLLRQSWRNLEVIVMTDSGGRDHISSIDPTLFENERIVFVDNGTDVRDSLGAGLEKATGELIMTHPPGSWAHPQRVEAQASALLVDPGLRGTISSHVRVSDELIPRPLDSIPSEDLIGPNPRSAMVRASGKPRELQAELDRATANHSPVASDIRLPAGIELVNGHVPLTLSMERSRSVPEHGVIPS